MILYYAVAELELACFGVKSLVLFLKDHIDEIRINDRLIITSFLVFTLIEITNIITAKTQHNAEIACINRMWQFGLKLI